MSRPVRVLSLYEGFFSGGARILHSDVVAGLHTGGAQEHRVLSLSSRAAREASIQPIHADPRYLRLTRAGVEVTALDRTAAGAPARPDDFSDWDLHVAAHALADADVVLSLKEQPLGLIVAGAGLSFAEVARRRITVGGVSVVKLLVMPFLMWGVCRLLGGDQLAQALAMLCGATPGAAASYMLARQMGGDAPLMAGVIALTTVGGAITMPLFLALFHLA